MLHLHVNTLCLVHWPWNSLTSGALFKVILTMTESLCKTRRSRLIGSHFTCITSTNVIVLIFQLKKSSQWHISGCLLFRMRKWNSVFPFFSLINKITTSISQWVTPSRMRGLARIDTESWILVRGIEALFWRTVSEPPGPATALLDLTRRFRCFHCFPPVSDRLWKLWDLHWTTESTGNLSPSTMVFADSPF